MFAKFADSTLTRPNHFSVHRHTIFVTLAAMASSGLSGSESHGNGPAFSLENILGNDHDKLEHPDIRPEGWDEEDAEREAAHGYCVECEGVWYYSSPAGSPFMRWVLQTNQLKCAAKHVRMITAKCASQRNIEKEAGKSICRHP